MSENLENKAVRGSISQIILKALSNGDKYGYEICKDIENITNGKLILKQPSLYSSLRRMEEQELISSYWKDSLIGGRRHYYKLTNKGKEFFEENKKYWQNDDTILNNLPQKETTSNNPVSPTPLMSFSAEDNTEPSSTTYIANQENLFNLNRKTDKEIKKIDASQAEQESEFNKSYFQFDLFEQNIKFVKENSKQNKEVSAFTNKFSDMDNHTEEIEPVKQQKNETITPFTKAQTDDKLKLKNDSKATETLILKNGYENKVIAQPVLKNSLSKIERHEVYKDDNQLMQDKNLKEFELNSNTSLLNNNLEDNLSSTEDTNNMIIKNEINDTKFSENESTQTIDNTVKKSMDSISWDFETDIANDNSLFETNDYKDAIGKLYNNSRLQDPYEQNKFQTFKEIFPSSQFKAKKDNTENLNEESITDEAKNRINNYLQSSEESNIDCEDIKNLNSLYNLQGIEIKIHNSSENKKTNKTYTDKNKLNMVCSWVVSAIIFLELLITYLLLKGNNLIIGKQPFIYFLGIAFTLSYCIISTLENLFDRFRLVVIEKPFNKTIMQRLFIFIILAVVIFALNVVFGMTNLADTKFLSYWLIPIILSSNLLVSCLIYYWLLRSKNFNG